MNNHVIITKNAGHVVPRGYLQAALKECPNTIGITIQDVVEGEPLLEISAENKTMDVDDMMKIVDTCKDVRIVIVLGKVVQDFDPETDLQPFVFQQKVEGEDPQNILALHLEGDFPNYSKPGQGHTDEYNFWEDCIFPTLLEKFQTCEDLPAFYAKIAASPMRQLIENPIGHRGVAVFVPLEGDIIAYGRNDLGGEFDWGTTSNTFKWGTATRLEQAAETVISNVKKTGGRLARAMGGTASVSVLASPPPVKEEKQIITEDANGVHHTSGGNDPWKRWPGTSSKTHTLMPVPDGLMGNARNRWIRLFTNNEKGELPKGKDSKGFLVPVENKLIAYAQESLTTNDEVRDLVDRVKKFPGSAGAAVSQQMQEAHEVKNPPVKPDNRPTSDFLPETPADEANVSVELVTEWATNPKAPTSLEVQRIESKWPTFTKSRGITLSNVARWNIAEKKMFVKKCPNDAARLISELVLKLHEYGEFKSAVEVPETKETEKSPATAPAQPGPTPTAPAAKTGGRLARLKG